MIIPPSQASMSIGNMVGGVILLVALFVVILVCLFNLRYYVFEGNVPPEQGPSWRSWFSFQDHTKDVKQGKAHLDCEKGMFTSKPRLKALHPRSTIRRVTQAMLPRQPPFSPHRRTPHLQTVVKFPSPVAIKPRSRKNSEAPDQSSVPSLSYDTKTAITSGASPTVLPIGPLRPYIQKRHTSSFEASTGIGMGPGYRPPSPSGAANMGKEPFSARNSFSVEFAHYFNPFGWMATAHQESQEGTDLHGLECGTVNEKGTGIKVRA